MERILNFKCSPHFTDQISRRRIDPLAVSICLAKGYMVEGKKNKKHFILPKERIEEAIKQEYLKSCDYRGLMSLTVITRSNVLITAYGRYGDAGITNLNTF